MLVRARRTSSSCTGAFTAEMALAAVERTVNCSGKLNKTVSMKPISCHDSQPNLAILFHFNVSLTQQSLVDDGPSLHLRSGMLDVDS